MKGPLRNLEPAEIAGAVLVVCGGAFSAIPSVAIHEMELIPLMAGLAVLLISQARQEPLKIGFLFLLMLSLRIYLYQDERYAWHEIVLSDYLLVAIAFASTYRLSRSFWALLFGLLASLVPLAGLASFSLNPSPFAAGPFSTGALSVNQSAFLFGACLGISLSYLLLALFDTRWRQRSPLHAAHWLLSSLFSLFLLIKTGSRAGLLFPFLSFSTVLFLCFHVEVRQRMDQFLRRFSVTSQGLRRVKLLLGIGALSAGGLTVWAILSKMYASQRNSISDLHRLYLLRCYFGAMFSGENSFIYGLGFTRASRTLCLDVGLIKGTDQPHAHNIFAQVAADNGFFALLCLLLIMIVLILRAGRLSAEASSPVVLACLSLAAYVLIFLQIEGGWGKVSFLQVLIGITIGALSMPVGERRPADPPQQAGD